MCWVGCIVEEKEYLAATPWLDEAEKALNLLRKRKEVNLNPVGCVYDSAAATGCTTFLAIQ